MCRSRWRTALSYVPPPSHEALEAMGTLERYFHDKERLPILVDCALIHYQFETIHPFLDGNGRMGRLLVTFYLCWKVSHTDLAALLIIQIPRFHFLPPPSIQIRYTRRITTGFRSHVE